MSKEFLIIGGNSGIGLETVKALHGEATLTVASRSNDALTELGIQSQPFEATEPQPLQLPDKLDGLVYFPGTINLKPVKGLKADDFRKDFEVNVLGAVEVIKQAERALKKSDCSSIVLFSTVAVQTGMPFHASIAAAKGAIEGLARSLAAEYAPKIRVNVIAPSLTNSPLSSALLSSEDKITASKKRHPLNQIGQPEDIAQLVKFLLSDQSKFITGQIFGVDGGLSSTKLF